ncbi:hypothetical protein ONS96_000142 [Cadophora gregata f. sp. sojae]|nr:hypothetical protein ONS96_000142 [Cadophora gregata f. sp. sojae]
MKPLMYSAEHDRTPGILLVTEGTSTKWRSTTLHRLSAPSSLEFYRFICRTGTGSRNAKNLSTYRPQGRALLCFN